MYGKNKTCNYISIPFILKLKIWNYVKIKISNKNEPIIRFFKNGHLREKLINSVVKKMNKITRI